MDRIDRPNLPFDIDGVVYKLNDIDLAEEMGYTDGGKRPKSSRAIKFPCEQKQTMIKSIEWSVGRTGKLVPVANLEPTELAGTTVQRVTLHNVKSIKEMDLKIGSFILIQKSGDIIPYVVKKVSDSKNATPIDIPTECPACEFNLVWDNSKTTKVCKNPECTSQLNASINHWFKKLNVKGIGPGIISKLTDEDAVSWDGREIISSLPEMYYMLDNDRKTEHPFRKYQHLKDFFGEKAYENILKSVNSIKVVSLAKFIEALGVGQVGRMASEITAVAPTIEDIDKLTVDNIVMIDGFAEKKARGFVNVWKARRGEIKTLLKHIEIEEVVQDSDKLDGMKICITGSLTRPRNDFKETIEKNGGKMSSSVSAKLDYLICGADAGGKKDKAEKLGVKIITEDEFFDMI